MFITTPEITRKIDQVAGRPVRVNIHHLQPKMTALGGEKQQIAIPVADGKKIKFLGFLFKDVESEAELHKIFLGQDEDEVVGKWEPLDGKPWPSPDDEF